MSNLDAEKYLFAGPEKCGKSYLANKIARKSKRLAILDVNAQPSLAVGSFAVTTPRQFWDAWNGADRRKRTHVTWQVPINTDPRAAFSFLLHTARRVGGFDTLVDEAETFIPLGVKLNDIERAAAKRGRHLFGNILMTSQRPTDLHLDFRANCHNKYFFKGYEPSYVGYVDKTLRVRGEARDPLKELHALEEFECLRQIRDGSWSKMDKI